jgi:hypothetical protein
MKITDFMKWPRAEFWKQVDAQAEESKAAVERLWARATETILSQDDATECLNALFIHSHARIKAHSASLAKNYPTKQFTKNRLATCEEVWWTDHFTAGISRWSTLNWFSAAKRKKKNGKTGYAGASTHFVQGYHDLPFYIIPLVHGAWHEPRRNKDSFSIEYVNAGGLRLKNDASGTGRWHYWARALPESLVRELPPVRLDVPYRGVTVMQPFTQDQIINSIVLKRIVVAATNGILDSNRMSQHSDWRDGKTDMGPLWPYDAVNQAAYSTIPVLDYDFVQDTEVEGLSDQKGDVWDEKTGWDNEDEARDNPSFGHGAPTHDEDSEDESAPVFAVHDVQTHLVRVGYPITVDNKMGSETRKYIKTFQRKWNNNHPTDLL